MKSSVCSELLKTSEDPFFILSQKVKEAWVEHGSNFSYAL